MVRLLLSGLFLVLAACAVEAQTPAPDYAEIVEAGRPRMMVKTLSKEEQTQAGKAIKQWKAKKTEANLAALRPFAEAGDKASLQTMVDGYLHLLKTPKARGTSAALAKPETALKPLAALWATAAWQQGGTSISAAKALVPCMTNNMEKADPTGGYDYHKAIWVISSQTAEMDCGFDTSGTIPALEAIRIAGREGRMPDFFLPVTFAERPVISAAVLEEKRLNDVLAAYAADVGVVSVSEADRQWLFERANADPEVKRRLDEARFDQRLAWIARNGGFIEPNEQMWAYMQADPVRVRKYDAMLSARSNRSLNENLQVTATLAAGRLEDREASSWIAIKSSEAANLWWRTYGGNVSGNVPMLSQWCGSGVSEACALVQAANTAAEFREKYGDPASLNSGTFRGPDGSIDQGQFEKERADARAACLAANINGGAGCTD